MWAEVLGGEAAEPSASVPRAEPVAHAGTDEAEQAFFDRGVSLRHATVIDDADTFADLDDRLSAQMASSAASARRRKLQALVAAVVAAAAALLVAGPGRTVARNHLTATASRLAPTEASMTACSKSEQHGRRVSTAAKAPPTDRRR